MIIALVVLASLAASGSMTLEPCDIAVDVVHSTQWGFGPTHKLNGGWFYVPQYNAVHWRAISATNDPKRTGPLIPVNRAVGRRNSKAETRSDLVRMGHFHQHGALANVVMNSSMIGYSEYGAGKFAYARPSQTFCVIDPKHGQTLVREVLCR